MMSTIRRRIAGSFQHQQQTLPTYINATQPNADAKARPQYSSSPTGSGGTYNSDCTEAGCTPPSSNSQQPMKALPMLALSQTPSEHYAASMAVQKQHTLHIPGTSDHSLFDSHSMYTHIKYGTTSTTLEVRIVPGEGHPGEGLKAGRDNV